MAKGIGRDFVLNKDGTPIAGVRTKSYSISNETIDFTDDDSAGWQELATASGQRSVTISVSGVYDDDVLLTSAIATDISDSYTLVNSARTIAGTFMITSYSESGEHTGEVTFEAEMTSSGAITVT